MIYIRKGREPSSLTAYKKQKYAFYDGYEHKGELRQALLRDQGYICAYCMRRIENNSDTMKIEHWKAQSSLEDEKEKLDFRYLLGVCDGCRGNRDEITTCDEHRHNKKLYVNPFDQSMMDTISYDRWGYIKSSNEDINKDLDETLNLNCEGAPSRIVLNRKLILEECYDRMKRIQNKGLWTKSTLIKVLNYYREKPDGKNREYVGVAYYVLNRYLKKL